jgi:hypothetical protein
MVEKKADVVEIMLEVVDDDELVVVVLDGYDLAVAFALLSPPALPSKVTRAFSDMQDRFAELKRPRRTVGDRGILKFDWASERRRGIE